jgi:hypothetical protein
MIAAVIHSPIILLKLAALKNHTNAWNKPVKGMLRDNVHAYCLLCWVWVQNFTGEVSHINCFC